MSDNKFRFYKGDFKNSKAFIHGLFEKQLTLRRASKLPEKKANTKIEDKTLPRKFYFLKFDDLDTYKQSMRRRIADDEEKQVRQIKDNARTKNNKEEKFVTIREDKQNQPDSTEKPKNVNTIKINQPVQDDSELINESTRRDNIEEKAPEPMENLKEENTNDTKPKDESAPESEAPQPKISPPNGNNHQISNFNILIALILSIVGLFNAFYIANESQNQYNAFSLSIVLTLLLNLICYRNFGKFSSKDEKSKLQNSITLCVTANLINAAIFNIDHFSYLPLEYSLFNTSERQDFNLIVTNIITFSHLITNVINLNTAKSAIIHQDSK